MNLQALLGVAGVHPRENESAKQVGAVLNVLVLAALIFMVVDLVLFYTDNPLTWAGLNVIVWAVFVTEFFVNLSLVNQRRRYVQQNWLNLFVIIVAFPWMDLFSTEWALILRSLRLLLLIRFFSSFFRTTSQLLSRNRFGQILIGFVFLVIGAGGVFSYLEDRPFIDGFWYALVTITTVGYGDVVPLTETGRMFGTVLIIFGVLFFSLVTANFAAFLVGSEQRKLERDILRTVHQIEKHLALQSNQSEKNTEKLIQSLVTEIDELKREVDLLKKEKID